MGRHKTPSNVLDLQGSPRAKNRRDVEGDRAPPRCPQWLPAKAKTIWKEVSRMLQALGIRRKSDRHIITRYAITLYHWQRDVEHVEAYGPQYAVPGQPDASIREFKEHPAARRAERLSDQLLRFERHLGLTPAARRSLALDVSDPDENRGRSDDDAEYFAAWENSA